MSDMIKQTAELATSFVEGIGVLIITGIALYVLVYSLVRIFQREDIDTTFRKIRRRLGRGILLGLEFLVAADIIHTVAVDLTLKSVGVLVIVVLIRTFLSFTLEVELTGRWPWKSEYPENMSGEK
jgi:uncharacterized membrane protein